MLLAEMGVSEAEAREHSIDWVTESLKAVVADRKRSAAMAMESTFLGAAAAFHGGEMIDHMQATARQLNADGEAVDRDTGNPEMAVAQILSWTAQGGPQSVVPIDVPREAPIAS